MTNRQKLLLKKIAKQAVKLDWEKAFDGKSYGNKHLFRVNKIAKYLQRKEGGNEFVVLVGAWVHDVALAYGNDSNPRIVRKQTKKFLESFKNLTTKKMDRIIECATNHEVGGGNLSLEAQIVYDADVVDKSGMLGVIRHIWKMTNLLENRILDKKNDVVVLEKHLKNREQKLFTKTAKSVVRKLNKGRDIFFLDKMFAREFVLTTSKMSNKGIISDRISMKMMGYKHQSINLLNEQLSLKYLE